MQISQRTKLLISVRSAAEAGIALEAGADIIDVKEPTKGSLGRSDTSAIEEIADIVTSKVPLSIALGEWHQSRSVTIPQNVAWAKVGFSRCSTALQRHRGWLAWLQLQHQMHSTRLIGVVYADRVRVGGPGFSQVLDWVLTTKDAGPHPSGILIDTAVKDGRGLLAWQSMETLLRYQEQCRRHGLFLALAGSLTFSDVLLLQKKVKPDVIAVRGLVLRRERPDRFDSARSSEISGTVPPGRLLIHHEITSSAILGNQASTIPFFANAFAEAFFLGNSQALSSINSAP
ncbi:MAG: (5-formylfuran-3-yl)methyl phosphate synthase [Gemmatales bacterium]